MKKLLALSALALVFSAPYALAQPQNGGKMGGDRGHKMMERMFDQADTNGDGEISKEEFMAQAEARFKEIDQNGDDKITKEEVEAHREKMRQRWQEMKQQHKDMGMGNTPSENSGE